MDAEVQTYMVESIVRYSVLNHTKFRICIVSIDLPFTPPPPKLDDSVPKTLVHITENIRIYHCESQFPGLVLPSVQQL
jgi:hypothetical protein